MSRRVVSFAAPEDGGAGGFLGLLPTLYDRRVLPLQLAHIQDRRTSGTDAFIVALIREV